MAIDRDRTSTRARAAEPRGRSTTAADVGSRLVFPSKRDLWLVIVLWAAIASMVLSVVTIPSGPGSVVVRFAALPVAALILWVLYGTGYVVQGNALYIRSGPFRWTLRIDEIRSVEPTRNPLSGPACSLDRLELRHGSRAILVSPADQRGFVDALLARNPDLVVDGEPQE